MKKLLLAMIMAVCLITSLSANAFSFAKHTDDPLAKSNNKESPLGNTWDKN